MNHQRHNSVQGTSIASVAALAIFASAGLAQDYTWNSATSDNWNNPARWTPAGTPTTSTANALINIPGIYTITIPSSTSTHNISSTNTDATIILNAGLSHDIFGHIDHDGLYTVNPNGVGLTTSIFFNNTDSIFGTGTIRLGAHDARARIVANAGVTITHTADHTIAGWGRVQGDMINNGTIDADSPGHALNYNTGNLTNNALMLASLGTLNLTGGTVITQSPTAVIRADGGLVTIPSASITGGTIEGINGSFVQINDSSSTFDSVTTKGQLIVDAGRDLTISNALDNNGTLTVNPNNVALTTSIFASTDTLITGTGTIRLAGSTNRARFIADPGITYTQDTNHTIAGWGNIHAAITNNGQITADVTNQTLTLRDAPKANNAQIKATNTGVVEFNSTTIDQTGGGQIEVENGTARYVSSTILAGSLTGTTGSHVIDGTNTFDQVTNEHLVQVQAGRQLNINNQITNNGSISVNPTNTALQTSINFLNSGSFSGTGQVILSGSSNRSQITTDTGAISTNGPSHTITGWGRITADMTNNGLIDASTPTQLLSVQSPTLQNNATMTATGGGILELASGSVITQSPSAQILADNSTVEISSADITGGQFNALGTGGFVVDLDSTIDSVHNNATVTLQAGRQLAIRNALTNDAELIVNPTNSSLTTSLQIQSPLTIAGSGQITLSGYSTRARITSPTNTDTLTNGVGHTLAGAGLIATPLLNNGILAPGFSVGEMDANAPITMGSTGVLQIEANGPNSADILDSSSTFHAEGTLNLSLIDGFTPNTAWFAIIVSADAGVTGTFDTLIAPPPPLDPRLTFKVRYFDNEIRVGAVCDSDIDFNGELDFFDVSMFLSLFAQQDPSVDFNGDTQFDFFDVSLFLSSFGASCP